MSLGRWATWVINWVMRVEESNFLAPGGPWVFMFPDYRTWRPFTAWSAHLHARTSTRRLEITYADPYCTCRVKRATRTFLIRHLPPSISCAFLIRRRPIWRPAIMNGQSAKVHVFAVFILFREVTLRCLSGGAALIYSVNTQTRRRYIKKTKTKKKGPSLKGLAWHHRKFPPL